MHSKITVKYAVAILVSCIYVILLVCKVVPSTLFQILHAMWIPMSPASYVDYIRCQLVCCCGEQVILLWQLRISANTGL